MAKVYVFPKKKELPEHIKEEVFEIGRCYVKTLHEALTVTSSDNPTQEELGEITLLVQTAFAQGIGAAIAEFEEEL